MNGLEPVRWAESGDAVEILDQTLLPETERRIRIESAHGAAEAIRSLRAALDSKEALLDQFRLDA